MDVAATSWSFTVQRCQSWERAGDTARVSASNYVGDSLDFMVALHPDGYAAFFDVDSYLYSAHYLPFEGDNVIRENLIDDIEDFLGNWQKRINLLRTKLSPKNWPKTKGIAADDQLYALVALLYEERAQVGETAITEALAGDMDVSLSTCKERIRKTREKGFLSMPGKGAGGQAEITNNARKLLKERGVNLDA